MNRLLKKFLIPLLILFLCVNIVLSQENSQENDLKRKIEEYQKKLTELRQQKNTLASQIEYMDTQIYLTNLKIQQTEEKIEKTTKEIDALETKIGDLDKSLDHLSKLLLNKVVQSYKQKELSFLNIFFDSLNANALINKIKYLKTVRDNNQRLLIQVQQTKLNFEEQKKLREEKMIELDNLKSTLAQQKIDLNTQKAAKQKLLADTQNSETIYQQMLAQAQRQLSAFKSFIQQSGATSVISSNYFGTGSDGNYYSQRDERWAYQLIGYSSENILNVGCLITSIAMVGKKMGLNISPSDIVSNYNNFYGLTAYLNLSFPYLNGIPRKSISIGEIDNYLNSNKYVIVGVYRTSCSWGGDHFVVLTKKEGGRYKMHDPIYGPDKNFYDYYSSICSAYVY